MKQYPKPDWCREEEDTYRCLKCGEYFAKDWEPPEQCDRCKDLRRETARMILSGMATHSGFNLLNMGVRRAIEVADKLEDELGK